MDVAGTRKILCATVLGLAVLVVSNAWPLDLDPFVGIYEGTFSTNGREPYPAQGYVIAEGPGLYRVSAQYRVEAPVVQNVEVDLHGHLEGQRVAFNGISESVWWVGQTFAGKLTLNRTDANYGGAFELERVLPHSPTEGLEPPDDAVIVLPFNEGQPTNLSQWTNQDWKTYPDGSMEVVPGTGPNLTVKEFGDIRLHLEFATPNMPLAFGQMRGNSGIYIQQRYEVQILDSFGVLAGAGDCGAIYELAAPRANASYPPGMWQTYDIEFHAPRMNADGTVRSPARLTVDHNGVRIHEDQEVPEATPGGIVDTVVEKGPLYLQDHGDPVRFRNIWLVPIGEE